MASRDVTGLWRLLSTLGIAKWVPKRFVISLVCFSVLGNTSGNCESPQLFKIKDFTCAHLAAAVNYYVAMGEENAVRDLESQMRDWNEDAKQVGVEPGCSPNLRICWVCRLLFLPNENCPIRPPKLGSFSLPELSMPNNQWPLYPLAKSGSSYFVLSESLRIFGKPEKVSEYLLFCRKNGSFRKAPIIVPSKETALLDFESIKKSTAWKAIRWSDRGEGISYTYSESAVLEFIRLQAAGFDEEKGE